MVIRKINSFRFTHQVKIAVNPAPGEIVIIKYLIMMKTLNNNRKIKLKVWKMHYNPETNCKINFKYKNIKGINFIKKRKGNINSKYSSQLKRLKIRLLMTLIMKVNYRKRKEGVEKYSRI